jgi:uncharacterized SAM-binding protein YcdF (DUF218 family)
MTYIEPLLGFFLVVAAVGAFRLRKVHSRAGWLLLAGGLTGIFLTSWIPVPWAAGLILERRYDLAFPSSVAGAGAIVVLSANVLPPAPWRPLPLLDGESFQRVNHAGLVFRSHPLPIIVSGGRPPGAVEAYAESMRRFLIDQSIPPDRIWVEDKSTSTFENAAKSAEILRDRGIRKIVLVTNAYHMLRAESCFRKQGIEVIAAPSAFNTFPRDFANLLPGWRGLSATERILHEYIGLAWYLVRGYV